MGRFGISRIWSGIKEKGREIKGNVKEFGKKLISKGKEVVTNVYGAFSGKRYTDEADKIYKEITETYDTKRRKFEEDVNLYTNRIESYVTSINKSKIRIKTELFPKMADLMKRIKDVDIVNEFPIEEFINVSYSFDQVRAKSDLYKIDFNKNAFKSHALAIFTLGFATRKKAKEALYAVQEERKKLESEIAKMDVEIKRLEAIEKSLQNVDGYFKSLIGLYEAMLVRFDGAVNFLYLKCISFAHKLIDAKLSIKLLPKVQQKEIEAIVTMSKILKQMTETRILSIENKDEVSNYSKRMKTKCDEITKVYNAA